MSDQVDLELAAKLLDRNELERTGDRDPRVVDQPREWPTGQPRPRFGD
jgi:hypothetical protein